MAVGPFQLNSVASLTDLLTAAKNIVVALNTTAQNESNAIGNTNKAGISSTTLVSSNPGRLVNVIITTYGSATGSIYDSASTSTIGASNLIFTIPVLSAPSAGLVSNSVISVNIPLMYGLVVAPGTGQVVTVSYS